MPKSRRRDTETVDWMRLLPFRQIFETASFSAGQWISRQDSLPCYRFSDDVRRFIDVAYDAGVVKSFDWPGWQVEAERLATESNRLETADLPTLRKLLTTHLRKDRFSEGHLAAMFEKGHILAILRRVEALVGSSDDERSGEVGQVKRASQDHERTAGADSPVRELIWEVGAEGGSLSILRTRAPDGAWRFVALRDETTLADLLDENDHEGVSFADKSGSVDSFAAALELVSRYPWQSLMPVKVHEEYAATVMSEVLRRGGTEEVARWKSALSRRFKRRRTAG